MKKLLRIVFVVIVAVLVVWFAVFLSSPRGCPVKARSIEEKLAGPVQQIESNTMWLSHASTGTNMLPYSGCSETHDYDQRQRLIRVTSGGGSPTWKFVTSLKYDWHGDVCQINQTTGQKIQGIIRYQRDTAKHEIRGCSYMIVPSKSSKVRFFQRLLALINMPPLGKCAGTIVTKLDAKSRVVEVVELDQSGKQMMKMVPSYDGKGNLQSAMLEMHFGHKVTTVSCYDQKQNVTEQKSFEGSKLTEQSRFSYKYDVRGNWTERDGYGLHKENGKDVWKQTSVTTRTIRYYGE